MQLRLDFLLINRLNYFLVFQVSRLELAVSVSVADGLIRYNLGG